MLGRPPAVTVPALPDESAHVDEAASTASDVVPAPVTLMAVTIDAGRASLAPLIVTVTFDPDDPIAIAFALPVVETVHGPRNAVEVEPVAFVLASIGVDAVIVTTPGFALVTATAHVPSAAVTQDALPRIALAGVAVKVTVAPAIVAPDDVTVATTLAFDPTSTRAGADAVTITFDAGVGIGLALGVGVGLGDSVGDVLGVGDGLVVSVGDGDALGVGDGVGVPLGVGDELGDGDGVGDVDGEAAGVEDGVGAAGVESLGLGDGEAVGSPSDNDIDVGVHRLAIFDPFPETGAARATAFDVSTDPAGAYVGAGVFEGAALGTGVGDGSVLVVADGCGLTDGRAVVVGRADVDGATVDEETALGAGFADGTAECVAIGAVLAAGVGTVTGRGAGGCQSSGWTNASPVAASYRMIRTPDSAAHAARLAASVGRSVML
jgi:hypothetical protein